jgi:hypothetical protein
MKRVAWKVPGGDLVLELVRDNGTPILRACPRFGHGGKDDRGLLWTRDVENLDLDTWVPTARYTVKPGKLDLTFSRRNSVAIMQLRALERVPKRALDELHSWLRAVIDRAKRCRHTGDPLDWAKVPDA